ncbi:MAG: LysR family transcriptional regulator [Pseudomonadota bacterium]|nr:LysR family transcriptional regulator [Pseudomonadota bacterium]
MRLEVLQLLITAVERGSVAAAARQLRLSPSLASRQISGLEEELGAKLLIRTTRSLVPTECGSRLLDWARVAVDGWEATRDDIGTLSNKPSGLIRFASTDYAGVSYLPQILGEFCRTYPDIRLSHSTAPEPVQLLDGTCDIVLHSGRRPSADVVGRKLWQFRRPLVASPDFFERFGQIGSPADLANVPCLTHQVSEPDVWCFETPDKKLIQQPITAHVTSDNWSTITGMALCGIGVARLSLNMVRDFLAAGSLIEVLPQLRAVYSDGEPPAFWLLYAQHRPSARIKIFANHLISRLLRDVHSNASRTKPTAGDAVTKKSKK